MQKGDATVQDVCALDGGMYCAARSYLVIWVACLLESIDKLHHGEGTTTKCDDVCIGILHGKGEGSNMDKCVVICECYLVHIQYQEIWKGHIDMVEVVSSLYVH